MQNDAHAVFVGRREEMAQLQEALDGALAGRGSVYVLAGEPGIGKTCTTQQLVAGVRERGARGLVGRCYEDEGAPAYWPWIQIIRSYVCGCDAAALRQEMGAGAADIAQVVPDVAERLPDLSAPPSLEPLQARFRLFDAITAFLKRVASQQPLVLVLDDLQCADRPSLLLLEFLARESGDVGILTVATYRDTDVDQSHPLILTLAELARQPHFRRLYLRGFGEEDVGRLIELTAGTRGSLSLVARIHRETGGNPLFVCEIVRLLVGEGPLPEAGEEARLRLVLPRSVREVIGHRLRLLSDECNRVLVSAAVLGREFDLSALDLLTGLARAELLDTLGEAADARVVTEVAGTLGRFRFNHALIRETLLQSLSTIDRVLLHRQTAGVLETLYGEGNEDQLAELAHHFLQAAPGGDVDRAIDYAARAARRAVALFAYEEGAVHYQRALQALELKSSVDGGPRCELLLDLGDVQTRAGDAAHARETFQCAADLARELCLPEPFARAVLGWGMWVDRLEVSDHLVELLEEALALLRGQDTTLRAAVLGRLARSLYGKRGTEQRRALLIEEAVQVARRIGDQATLASVLSERRYALWGPDNAEQRLADATEIGQLAEKTGHMELVLESHMYRMIDLLELGDMQGVDREIEAQARLAEELRQPSYQRYAATFLATRARFEGRYEEAERLAQQALTMGLRDQDPTALVTYGLHVAELRRDLGGLADVEASLTAFVDQYPTYSAWRCAVAALYCELGREAEARREFESLARNDFADLPRDLTWLSAVVLLAEVCASLGDRARAHQLYRLLVPYGHRNVSAAGTVCYGAAGHTLGRLATTMSYWEKAAQHFEDALTMNSRMGARPCVARTRYAYGGMLLRRGRPEDRAKAHEFLEGALEIAEELGMKPLGDQVRALRTDGDGVGLSRVMAPVTVPAVGEIVDGPLRSRNLNRGRGAVSEVASIAHARAAGASEVNDGRSGEKGIFRREGEYWTIAYRGTLLRLKSSVGLFHLAELLRHPGRELPAVALVATRAVDGTQDGAGDACEAGSRVERARVNVTRTIKAAVRRIGAYDGVLERHLTATIRTGTVCAYMPDPRDPVLWIF
jgi:tetratricopeptide (TPR) repeat protein